MGRLAAATTAPTLLMLTLVVACGAGPGDSPTARGGAGRVDLAGRFGGDAHLEGGCAWLETLPGRPAPDPAVPRYQPVWPAGYEVVFEPLRLLNPAGRVVATDGQEVRVQGQVMPERVTVCQTGPVFQVTEVVGPA